MAVSTPTSANATGSATLPSPHDRPQADILIYDGHCRICRAQIARLHRWDTRGVLAYLSLHDAEVARRFPDLSHETLMSEMVLVDQQGQRHHGAEAVRYLSRRLPRLWPLSPILHLPGMMPVWQWCYRRVANWRYRLGGRVACDDGSCQLHR
jgi:predicted DCC family thiol-disulfide oxidoreductase YuxK